MHQRYTNLPQRKGSNQAESKVDKVEEELKAVRQIIADNDNLQISSIIHKLPLLRKKRNARQVVQRKDL